MRIAVLSSIAIILASPACPAQQQPVAAEGPSAPLTVTDYDQGDFYLVRDGEKQPYHGMRDSWVFNQAMVWLDDKSGVAGAVLCYSSQSPLLLTGKKQVSRWYAGEGNELTEVDDEFTRFMKKDPKLPFDHAALPPFQFHIEQHPKAELEVTEATHPWQLFIVVKGRGGPPLYVSPWHSGPGKLTVDVLKLYRQKGYDHHFAELNFFVATWTKDPQEQAGVVFRLCLEGDNVIVPSLPIIRTAERARSEGVPIYAVVLDPDARRLGKETVEVTASLGNAPVRLSENGSGIWKAVVRGLPVGQHKATLRAVWKNNGQKSVSSTLDVRVTDGQFVGYDPKLKLLTQYGKPLGPITGSYRGQAVFKGIGTPGESLLHGQRQWEAAITDKKSPDYGFHFWESLTPSELEEDYAYLDDCGWDILHLCSAWLWWPRFDAAGRLSPYYAEQLAKVCTVAGRHGLCVHLAVSHYPLGRMSPPYARYLEAGYQGKDYGDPKSKYFEMFAAYLAQLATVFRDETALSSFTAAGEGDPSCGKLFVNMANDALTTHDTNHLFFCEPHHQITQDPNYYRKTGWKPLLGGMRTYHIEWLKPQPPESVGVQFKLSAMGHVFMGEGCFYGFLGGEHQYMNVGMPIDSYRERVRETLYTGLAHRNPILLSWEERIVEDERVVFERVRRAVDWSKPFRAPRLAVRVGPELMPVKGRTPLFRYEEALSKIPLECAYVWRDEPVPPDTLHTIDARQPFSEPAFVSDGGKIPEAIKAEMPLRTPEGTVANYSWSRDRRTLLAFLRRAAEGDAGSGQPTAEGGDYTCVDTTLVIGRPARLDTWETECLKPGSIQLRIYRRQGEELVLVGQSEMVEMRKVGINRFSLKAPITAKQGDLIGFAIPSEDTEIAAFRGGEILYVEGHASPARTPLADWTREPKTARISAFSAADRAAPKPCPAKPARDLVLQNFPPGELSYALFDLAAKKIVGEGKFQETATVKIPRHPRHLFLLVGDVEGLRE